MILPNSNADVLQILSAMNYIKTRNSMRTDLLNAILLIKFGLISKRECCMSYKLPDSVVRARVPSQAYKSSTQTSCSTVDWFHQ